MTDKEEQSEPHPDEEMQLDELSDAESRAARESPIQVTQQSVATSESPPVSTIGRKSLLKFWLRSSNEKEPEVDNNVEASTSTKRSVSVKDSDEPKPPSGHHSTVISTPSTSKYNMLKIACIIAVWAIFAYFLVTGTVEVHIPRLLAIPSDGLKVYILPVKSFGKQMGIQLLGPFLVEDDLNRYRTDVAKSKLIVNIVRLDYHLHNMSHPNEYNITDPWRLSLMPKTEIRDAPVQLKKHVFDLLPLPIPNGGSKLKLILDTDVDTEVTVKLWYEPTPLSKSKGILYGTFVLIFLYVLIVWEIINRTFASIIASSLAIGIMTGLNERPSLETILSWIDVETLTLLFGMMILVAILSESGVFDYMAVFAYELTKGEIWPLINTLCGFVGILSAFLDNVTMMLLLTPVTIRLCEVLAINPVPILMCMVIFSNIGAALTPVGDPPNIIICNNPVIVASNVNFGNFFLHMVPGVILAAIQVYIFLRYKYRNIANLGFTDSPEVEDLRREINAWQRAAEAIAAYSKDESLVRETLLKKVERLKVKLQEVISKQQEKPATLFEETLKRMKTEYPIRNKVLLIKSSIAFFFVVAFFFLHAVPHFHHLSMGWTALIGALLLLILADVEDMEAILERIEWSTLLFFTSLFILMEALTIMGVIDVIGDLVVRMVLGVSSKYRLMLSILIILWVSAIASAFLDNIPVTTMMVKIVISLAQNKELELPLHPLVWALAFGACFGGNGTVIGASANVIAAGVIEQHGYKMSFVQFFIVGFPVMLGSIVVATGYLLFAHVLFTWH